MIHNHIISHRNQFARHRCEEEGTCTASRAVTLMESEESGISILLPNWYDESIGGGDVER